MYLLQCTSEANLQRRSQGYASNTHTHAPMVYLCGCRLKAGAVIDGGGGYHLSVSMGGGDQKVPVSYFVGWSPRQPSDGLQASQ